MMDLCGLITTHTEVVTLSNRDVSFTSFVWMSRYEDLKPPSSPRKPWTMNLQVNNGNCVMMILPRHFIFVAIWVKQASLLTLFSFYRLDFLWHLEIFWALLLWCFSSRCCTYFNILHVIFFKNHVFPISKEKHSSPLYISVCKC